MACSLLEQLARCIVIRTFQKGDTIVTKAAPLSAVHIVMEGECVTSDPSDAKHQPRSYVRGMVFSTTALFTHRDPNAREPLTVGTSSDEARIVTVDTGTYAQLAQPIQDAFSSLAIEKIVKETPVLNALSDDARRDMASSMTTAVYRRNETIMTQGEVGDNFYVILAGTCEVLINREGSTNPNERINVRTLYAGEYMGEMALLHSEPRSATIVTSADPTVCAVIDKASFEVFVGSSLSGLMEEAIEMRMRQMNEEIRAHVTVYDLRIHRTIGVGRFGRIKLCVHKPTGAIYALKSLRKAKVLAANLVSHTINERQILLACNYTFIPQLVATFQELDFLHMLLELVQARNRYVTAA